MIPENGNPSTETPIKILPIVCAKGYRGLGNHFDKPWETNFHGVT